MDTFFDIDVFLDHRLPLFANQFFGLLFEWKLR